VSDRAALLRFWFGSEQRPDARTQDVYRAFGVASWLAGFTYDTPPLSRGRAEFEFEVVRCDCGHAKCDGRRVVPRHVEDVREFLKLEVDPMRLRSGQLVHDKAVLDKPIRLRAPTVRCYEFIAAAPAPGTADRCGRTCAEIAEHVGITRRSAATRLQWLRRVRMIWNDAAGNWYLGQPIPCNPTNPHDFPPES
jgi:hypothetical protein